MATLLLKDAVSGPSLEIEHGYRSTFLKIYSEHRDYEHFTHSNDRALLSFDLNKHQVYLSHQLPPKGEKCCI